jgi:hypothetical protein
MFMLSEETINKMMKARVVSDLELDDVIVTLHDVYHIHPAAKIIKDFSNVVKNSPILEVSKIYNHNKIKKPKKNRKLARISARGISLRLLSGFLKYD